MTSTGAARLTKGLTGDRWFLAVSGVDDLHESVPPPKAFLFCNQKRNRKKFDRFRGGQRATRVSDPGPLLPPAADGGQKQ